MDYIVHKNMLIFIIRVYLIFCIIRLIITYKRLECITISIYIIYSLKEDIMRTGHLQTLRLHFVKYLLFWTLEFYDR